MPENRTGKQPSAWSPLRYHAFRNLWIAAVASNIGSTMHDTGAAWLMTSLTQSAVMISLMQTASSLPIFLVALPAGALADLVDRRRLLITTQFWMMASAAALGVLSLLHLVTPWVLLILTFVMGLASAINIPAWQATTPELVPRSRLQPAIALNGVGYNLARAIGPALGGVIIGATGGPWSVFLLNAISFLGVILVFYFWKRKPRESEAPAERILGAIRAGTRYVLHAPPYQSVLVRTGAFISCGSCFWGLLPYLARHEFKLSAIGYGGWLACFGLGAVAGANMMPRLRRKMSIDRMVALANLIFALTVLSLAYTRIFVVTLPMMAIAGAFWMTLMSTLNASAQMAVPAWVRARALAVYLLIFQGGLALGSVFWGVVAQHYGSPVALTGAAVGMLAGLAIVPRFRLIEAEGLDLRPSLHWAQPLVETEPDPEHGPVLIQIEYRIDPAQTPQFADAMRAVRRIKRRDGAMRWGLFNDVADPGRCIETYVVESWAEHLRQHERITVADRVIEQRAASYHIGETPPVVTHFISSYGYANMLEEALPDHNGDPDR